MTKIKTAIKIAIILLATAIFLLMFLPFISLFFAFLSSLSEYVWTESIEILQDLCQMK